MNDANNNNSNNDIFNCQFLGYILNIFELERLVLARYARNATRDVSAIVNYVCLQLKIMETQHRMRSVRTAPISSLALFRASFGRGSGQHKIDRLTDYTVSKMQVT